MRNYPRLGMVEFGRHLLSSGDLDPVYVALNGAGYDDATRNRWLTAYCAYYSCAVACHMSALDGSSFWAEMFLAAENEVSAPYGGRWPRGHERRHFRGGQAVAGVRDWRDRYPTEPHRMFALIAGEGPESFASVRERALKHRSVGDWLSFKMVDLVDACMGVTVDQSDITPFLYETPRAGLLEFWRQRQGLPPEARPKDEPAVLRAVLVHLEHEFQELSPPHKLGQRVDMFSLETIACKFKSHLNGHYPLWNDVDEITRGFEGWPETDISRAFLTAMPSRSPPRV